MAGKMAKERTSVSSRSGMARDQLIFTIICSVAIGVAIVTVVVHTWSGKSGGIGSASWQCLKCDAVFNKKTTEQPPIACEKCDDGQAVRLSYRKCRACGKKVLATRSRLTPEGKAQHEEMMKAQADGGRPPMPGMGMGMMPGMGMGSPMEMQFWYKGTDGNYTWSEWIPSQMAGQYYSSLTCEKCGASLRSGRSKSR